MNLQDEKLADESISQLPEAPVSITIHGYYKGFSVLFTKRLASNNLADKIDNITALIELMISKNYQPSWNTETNNAHQLIQTPATSQQVNPQTIPQGNLGNCQKCGSPNKVSSKGNVFCSAKCWLRG